MVEGEDEDAAKDGDEVVVVEGEKEGEKGIRPLVLDEEEEEEEEEEVAGGDDGPFEGGLR